MSLSYGGLRIKPKVSRLSSSRSSVPKAKSKKKVSFGDDDVPTKKSRSHKSKSSTIDKSNPFYSPKPDESDDSSEDNIETPESMTPTEDLDEEIEEETPREEEEEEDEKEKEEEYIENIGQEKEIGIDSIEQEVEEKVEEEEETKSVIDTNNNEEEKDDDDDIHIREEFKEEKKKKKTSKEDRSNPFLKKEKKPRTPRGDDDAKPEKKHRKSRSPPPPESVNPFINTNVESNTNETTPTTPKGNPFLKKDTPKEEIPEPIKEEKVEDPVSTRTLQFLTTCQVPPSSYMTSQVFTTLPIPPNPSVDIYTYIDQHIINYLMYLNQNHLYQTILNITVPILYTSQIDLIQDYTIFFSIYLYHIYALLGLDKIEDIIDIYNNREIYQKLFIQRDSIYTQHVPFELKVIVACFPAYIDEMSVSLQNLYSLYLALQPSNTETESKLYRRSRAASVLAVEENKKEIGNLKEEEIQQYKQLIEKEIIGLLLKEKNYITALTFIDTTVVTALDNEKYMNYLREMAIKVCIQSGEEEKAREYIEDPEYNENEMTRYFKTLLTMRMGSYFDAKIQLEQLLQSAEEDSLKLSCANNFCVCSLHCSTVEQAIDVCEKLIQENPYIYANRTLLKNLTYMYDLILTPIESKLRKTILKKVFEEYEIEHITDSDLRLLD